MKFNSSLITLSIGLTIAIVSYANAASAEDVFNGFCLTDTVSSSTSQEHIQFRDL